MLWKYIKPIFLKAFVNSERIKVARRPKPVGVSKGEDGFLRPARDERRTRTGNDGPRNCTGELWT